jgi:hypothetical protein
MSGNFGGGRGAELAVDGLLGTSFRSAGPARAGDGLQVDFRLPVHEGTVRVAWGDDRGRGRDIPAVIEATTNRVQWFQVAEIHRSEAEWTMNAATSWPCGCG